MGAHLFPGSVLKRYTMSTASVLLGGWLGTTGGLKLVPTVNEVRSAQVLSLPVWALQPIGALECGSGLCLLLSTLFTKRGATSTGLFTTMIGSPLSSLLRGLGVYGSYASLGSRTAALQRVDHDVRLKKLANDNELLLNLGIYGMNLTALGLTYFISRTAHPVLGFIKTHDTLLNLGAIGLGWYGTNVVIGEISDEEKGDYVRWAEKRVDNVLHKTVDGINAMVAEPSWYSKKLGFGMGS